MAPELLNSIDAEELRGLAQRVREYQEGRGLSDNGLFKKFGGLGSTTTYKKILQGELKELNLERQLTNYRSVVALLESLREEDGAEELIEDLVPALELRRAFLETSSQSTIGRLILIDGDTGTGKTKAALCLVQKFGSRFIFVEADESWNDKPHALLGSILRQLGVKELPNAQFDRMEMAVLLLNQTRQAVIVDEAHHMGPACLNIVKTLINRTPGEFILAAMRTLWNRLERESYQEVKQLTGNRLAERIKLSLRESDIRKLLDQRLSLNGDTKRAVAICMQYAPSRGNLAFVRSACRRARDQAGEGEVTFETFTNAVSAEVEAR